MFICVGHAGSPVARPQVHDMLPTNRDLQNLLPTNRDLQPKSEVACPTSQISSTVTDGVKAQDTKSNSISLFCFLINLTLNRLLYLLFLVERYKYFYFVREWEVFAAGGSFK